MAAIYDARTAMTSKDEALARVEAASMLFSDIAARKESNVLLRRALRAWKKSETAKAAKLALQATEADDSNAQAFHLLAIVLEKLGHLHKALVTYQQAAALDPDDPDLLLNLGLTAWNLQMFDGAERMFRLFCEKRPERPEGYNNLASVLRDRGDLQAALDTLQTTIYRMPGEPMLWNTLATVLAEEGRLEESLVFYQEALRLKPDFGRVWHNLGYAYSHMGRLDEALDAYDHALAFADNANERIEGEHSRAICLIGMGRIAEGFAGYEIRNDPAFRASVLHYTKAPLWKGDALEGKRILLVGEQGLGDEFMFANIIPDVIRAVGPSGKVQIAVDPRLVSLFQRSFPETEVGDYDDRKLDARHVRIFPWALKNSDPDFHAPMGTPLHVFRKTLDDFPHARFLTPDPARVAAYRAELDAQGSGPVVGICWRSMVTGAKRKKYYTTLEDWAPLLSVPGLRFVNLQYGDCAAELNEARERHGLSVHTIAGLDLRNDIEGAAALSAACDLVISAPTAAAALAGAVGAPVWFIVAGRVWPQLGTDHYPWYRESRVFAPDSFGDWQASLAKARVALATAWKDRPSKAA